MSSAATIRSQIEAALAHKIPSALTPVPRIHRPVTPTGVREVDESLEGGLPVGAITQLVGPECSGRSSLALAFVAGLTRTASVCAWIDVSDTLDPESAAAQGVDLARLLWVRCGVAVAGKAPSREGGFVLPAKFLTPSPAKQGLHGGGCGGHPRGETKGLPEAMHGLFRPEALAPRCAEPVRKERPQRDIFTPPTPALIPKTFKTPRAEKPWSQLDQALRAVDLLLQAGGFRAIVVDMGGIAPEHASRVPLATWFRYRAVAEKTQASVILLTQHACAKSAGELLLRLKPGEARDDELTVFTGIAHGMQVERRRFGQAPTNVVLLRKPPQSVRATSWQSRATWAGAR